MAWPANPTIRPSSQPQAASLGPPPSRTVATSVPFSISNTIAFQNAANGNSPAARKPAETMLPCTASTP
jgi:hypothetical protein